MTEFSVKLLPWPNGQAPDFYSGLRGFESFREYQMMKQTSSQRCDTYDEAVKAKAEASAKAQKDFGGKAEEKWKVRIKLRSGYFDVTTHKLVPPPKKEQEKSKAP